MLPSRSLPISILLIVGGIKELSVAAVDLTDYLVLLGPPAAETENSDDFLNELVA